MQSILLHDAKAVLRPHHDVLEECVRAAWEQYSKTIPHMLPLMSPRGKANIIHEFIAHEARMRLDGRPGISLNDTFTGRLLVNIQNQVLLTFKKLNRAFETVNYPTPTAKLFNAQKEIEGLPRCVRLTVGYQLTRFDTALAGVYILYGTSRRPTWYYNLLTPEHNPVVELPFHIEEAMGQGSRVRAKPAAQTRAASDSNG